MKFSLLVACVLVFVSMSIMLVQADSLQDEIDAAKKKFCGGIAVSAPATNAVFTSPSQVKVTVTRKPDAQAKIVNAVDVYTIDNKGKAKYIATAWKGNYALNKKATLTVNLSKVSGLKYPGQFEFRVWVHNKAGPDCTLMSKVFKVRSSNSHSNAADEQQAFSNLDQNIDRGCFGVEITAPKLGEHIKTNTAFPVHIQRDSAAHLDTVTSLTLMKIDLDSRKPTEVKSSYSTNQTITQMLNIKDTIDQATPANTAYFYKLTGTTQHDETCEFYSHPFYVEA
ncbi:uncharacterized protein BX664DRAFT_337600 [Halteromyces radiatus]|uniref:uncharacterized protein n=1 Tax=Halteromyces radiatus TaxID=101107 RepID=UPI00221F17FA|nr:uncharacterized protein BX664DRAFT_337600 [Halteromyces radiatus]KAI8084710.1 hypothetical protein BX664DRAFT_337600 [Halteromyces radiatus]